MSAFSLTEYKDPGSGQTPTDDLVDALNSFPDDGRHLIKMAAFMRSIADEGQLYGRCFEQVQPSGIQIWVYSQGKFHIIYSFYRLRNEICLLKFVNGDPKLALGDARKRLRLFYT